MDSEIVKAKQGEAFETAVDALLRAGCHRRDAAVPFGDSCQSSLASISGFGGRR
jgi:hypothetical protein